MSRRNRIISKISKQHENLNSDDQEILEEPAELEIENEESNFVLSEEAALDLEHNIEVEQTAFPAVEFLPIIEEQAAILVEENPNAVLHQEPEFEEVTPAENVDDVEDFKLEEQISALVLEQPESLIQKEVNVEAVIEELVLISAEIPKTEKNEPGRLIRHPRQIDAKFVVSRSGLESFERDKRKKLIDETATYEQWVMWRRRR